MTNTGTSPDMNAFANPEAESSVLGACLQDAKAVRLAAELDESEFTDPAHRIILAAVKGMANAGIPVDLVTLDSRLSAGNKLELIGGSQKLISLISQTPTTANVESYIRIVRECTARRRLREIGQSLISDSGGLDRDVNEIREQAALAIREVRAGHAVRMISQQDAMLLTYEKISEAQKKPDGPDIDRIMTGIPRLDKLTGGLTGSKLVIIGARPSVGKSIFATSICMNAAKHGKRVLYVSLEMEEDEIIERELAATSLVPLSEITGREIQADSFVKMAESLEMMNGYQIWYCTGTFTVEEIRRAAYSVYENGGIDLICVDYLQLMDATFAKRQNRQEQVSEISRGLKRLAQELKVPIIALSQLNRGNQREKRAPNMADARESGAIEQDANIFILLHDPDIDELKTDEKRRMYKNLSDRGMKLIHVNVDKNRQGRKGVFYLAFDGEHMRFLTIAKEDLL